MRMVCLQRVFASKLKRRSSRSFRASSLWAQYSYLVAFSNQTACSCFPIDPRTAWAFNEINIDVFRADL